VGKDAAELHNTKSWHAAGRHTSDWRKKTGGHGLEMCGAVVQRRKMVKMVINLGFHKSAICLGHLCLSYSLGP